MMNQAVDIGSVKFNVDKRYTPIAVVGTGAYGVVCSARDNKTHQQVAIKKIPMAFEITPIAKRTLLEVKLLKHFNSHENVVSLLNIIKPPKPPEPFNDVYYVMDLLESDLHRIIHSKQKLSIEHWRFFMYQLCRGLKFIHSANVLHRDIKPSNLLLTSQCHLKICDFGMARGVASTPDEHSGFMTAYVATRWYRAPEVMLSFKEYSKAIDVWSVGCIFAEMLGRKYVFAGTNYVNQLNLILNLLGTPSDELIDQIGSQKAQQYLRSLKKITAIPLARLYPHATAPAIDLLERMLLFDPSKRISMEDALAHPFLAKYHKPEDEPNCAPFDFEFEKQKLSTQSDLKKCILAEIETYHVRSESKGAMPQLVRHAAAGGGAGAVGGAGAAGGAGAGGARAGAAAGAAAAGGGGGTGAGIGGVQQQYQQQLQQQQQHAAAAAAHAARINQSMQSVKQQTFGGKQMKQPKKEHNDSTGPRKRVRVNAVPTATHNAAATGGLPAHLLGGVGTGGGGGGGSGKGSSGKGSGGMAAGGGGGQALASSLSASLIPHSNTATTTSSHHTATHADLDALPESGLDSLLAGIGAPLESLESPLDAGSEIDLQAIAHDLLSDNGEWLKSVDQAWLQPSSAFHNALQSDLEKGSSNIFTFD